MAATFDISGRVALVTGASRGLGLAMARGLLEAGASVVLNALTPERLAATAAALGGEFGSERVHPLAFDVCDEDQVAAAFASLDARWDALDILVNNAGIQHRRPLVDLDLEDWKRVIDVDLTSAFVVGRQAALRMIRRGRGKIINVCSVQSELARPSIAPYTAAKGGLRNLTRAMTGEWAPAGLQVNALAPGYIHTAMTEPLVADEHFSAWVTGRVPARRWGRPEDVVGPLLWLASPAADFVNGQTIFVDGGMTVVV